MSLQISIYSHTTMILRTKDKDESPVLKICKPAYGHINVAQMSVAIDSFINNLLK